MVGSCPGRWVVTRQCIKEVFLNNLAQTLGQTSRNQNCLNFMGASNIPIITGQMLLHVGGTVVGLCSLWRRQMLRAEADSMNLPFPLQTDLLNNKVSNSYSMNTWEFFNHLSLNQHSLQGIFDLWFPRLAKLDLEVRIPAPKPGWFREMFYV